MISLFMNTTKIHLFFDNMYEISVFHYKGYADYKHDSQTTGGMSSGCNDSDLYSENARF
jgi:hypothetical protein